MTVHQGALPAAKVGWRSHGLLLLLALVFADNFVGRQIVGVKGHPEKLEVSRSYTGLFKGM